MRPTAAVVETLRIRCRGKAPQSVTATSHGVRKIRTFRSIGTNPWRSVARREKLGLEDDRASAAPNARFRRALRLDRAARGVDELRRAALAAEQEFAAELDATAPSMRESAYNLVHYLAVRRHDVRELQDELTRLGLSSLGPHGGARDGLAAARCWRCSMRCAGKPVPAEIAGAPPVTFNTGDALLAEHANAILGAARRGRADADHGDDAGRGGRGARS